MIKHIDDLSLLDKFKSYSFSLNNELVKVIVYEINDEKVGFIEYILIDKMIEIFYVFVLEQYRNQKIASQMLNYIINYSKQNQIDNLYLEVKSNNLNAIRLYEKHHFVKQGIRKKYYGDIDAINMTYRVGE